MKPIAYLLPLLAVACASETPPEESTTDMELTFTENIIEAPDFIDFLVVDGETVWATNTGRIEKYSTTAKLTEVKIPRPCGTMALDFGALWVANCDGGEVYRIDPESGEIVAKIPAGMGPSGELNVVAGAGSIWAPDQIKGSISRIDPETNAVIATIEATEATSYLAYGFDALWAASGKGGVIQRIDPASNTVTHTLELGEMPGFLVAGEGAVWIQEQGDGTLARIDPETVTVTERIKVGDNLKWGDIDTGDGKVWLRTTDDQTFVVIDAQSNEILARVGRAEGSGAIRYTPEGIWTSAHDVFTLNWWTFGAE